MNPIADNQFIKRLESGINTGLMLMAHNAYWCKFEALERKYDNFHAYIFGSGTAYTVWRKQDIPKDCDFILLDSSDYFSEYEMAKTKIIGQKIAEENNKRVTIGYVFFIPREEWVGHHVTSKMKIISIKNNAEDEAIITIEGTADLILLAGIIAEKHIEFENQKVLKRQ